MQILKYIIFIAVIVSISGCNRSQNSHGHSHDIVGGQADHEDQSQDTITLSFTLFSDNYELFVEFPALIVGQTSSFAAHFTRLNDYKPVSEGKLTVSIVKDGKGIRHSVEAPTSPGIFRPTLQPKEPGMYSMAFELESNDVDEKFEINEIEVYPDTKAVTQAAVTEDPGDEITYLKEQAWKTEFETKEIVKQPFYSVIHTSAVVKSQPQSEITLNAQAAGLIKLVTVLGESVKKGELLALITGSGIENNLTVKLNANRIVFEKSKADYIRSKPLVEKQIISEKDFLEIRSWYMQDSLKYFQMAELVSPNGLKVTAPFDGFVSSISVANGNYIETGNQVMTITNQNHLLIEAFINQSDFLRVNGIFDAHFRISGEDKIITLQEMNGEIKSKNAFVNSNATRIPAIFSAINNGSMMPGMFLEAYLLTDQKENALVIPLSAIVEEQGQYYVFVQSGGESFIKRQVDFANDNGIRTEVTQGLKVGDRIVTKGAIQIKLAALAGDLPLHGHTH